MWSLNSGILGSATDNAIANNKSQCYTSKMDSETLKISIVPLVCLTTSALNLQNPHKHVTHQNSEVISR